MVKEPIQTFFLPEKMAQASVPTEGVNAAQRMRLQLLVCNRFAEKHAASRNKKGGLARESGWHLLLLHTATGGFQAPTEYIFPNMFQLPSLFTAIGHSTC